MLTRLETPFGTRITLSEIIEPDPDYKSNVHIQIDPNRSIEHTLTVYVGGVEYVPKPMKKEA